ncbi:MAG: hypothetical protein VX908_01260 [Planctomycetota bacterium]|nr:hypothetical protein [Planctomycetota bacterium]
MIDTNAHVERFRELSRVWQWILLATIFMVAFLAWAYVIAPIGDNWAEQADRIEFDLHRTSSGLAMDAHTKNSVMIFGPLDLPNKKAEGSLTLIESVQQILANRGITNDTFYQSQSANIKASVLPGVARAGEKIERIKGELDFESKPDVAIAVIADMERSPDIEAISDLKIDKLGNGQVRTRLTIEAWVRTR